MEKDDLVDLPVLKKLPAPSDELIAKFERSNHISLPPDFVEFLKKYNGAVLDYVVFEDGRRERLIERFLCLLADYPTNPDGIYDMGVVMTQIDERLVEFSEDRLGYNVIPFGALFAGDFVCLDFRKSETPSVAVWDHEQSDEYAPMLNTVASSFAEFERMLHQSKP
jgi:hypothetical protein